MPSVPLFGYEPLEAAAPLSLDELVAEFVAPHAQSSNRRHGTAARHLLCWLKLRKIALSEVDDAVLERFSKHQCRCPRYRTTPRRDRNYMAAARMFVHLLAQRGAIPSRQQHGVVSHLASYNDHLRSQGYVATVVASMLFDARHFVYWVGCNADWSQIDRVAIERFARHDCSCPTAMSGRRSNKGIAVRRRHATKFVAYLVRQGVMAAIAGEPELDERLTAYGHWLATARGLPPAGVKQSLREVKRWYSNICGEGAACSAEALRAILLDQDPSRSKGAIDRTVCTLRSFVRFLIARDECPPDRLAALSVAPRRAATQVPRYIDRASIEQILAACDTSTPTGLRNRALLLLLARLGLRAGDLVAMQLNDIDWDQGTIRVSGKSARAARLPLPQDAGEAILAYIEQARPTVASKHLFLSLKAPYQPFAGPSIICWIIGKAVERTGLRGIPTGSHVFRHSLATSMLREGSTLEAIGTILRHSKPDTTAIYAKVDLNMLGEVDAALDRRCVMLIHHIERYVDYRRKLGVGFEDGERTLTLFARYADDRGDSHITISRIHEWCSQAITPESARTKYNLLRRFSMFLRAEDSGHAAAPIGAFGRRRRPRPAPHLLHTEQIAAIMAAALTLPNRTIKPYTYHCLFGLLAVTGMRVSEALGLQRSDLTRDGLLVRRSKGGGSRLLPIHPTTREAIKVYLDRRDRAFSACDDLFLFCTGLAPDRSTVRKVFVGLARQLGIRGPTGTPGPRLHDLRHSFAVRSLEACAHDYDAVRRHMTALRDYLGHSSIEHTYWYLEATPVLMRTIATANEHRFVGGVR